MTVVKSLEELKRVREEALRKREARLAEGRVQIVVGMGTPGIAAGARETVKAILNFIEQEGLAGVIVRQTGNLGLDSWEPIVQVRVGETEPVTYGHVTPEAALQIMRAHVVGGQPVADYLIPK